MPVFAAIWGFALFILALALPVTGVAFAFASVKGSRRSTIAARRFQAAGLTLISVLLVALVRSEDTYLNNGTTVWQFHQSAHGITVAAVCLGLAVAVALLAARRGRLATAALGASAAVAALQFAALIANSGD